MLTRLVRKQTTEGAVAVAAVTAAVVVVVAVVAVAAVVAATAAVAAADVATNNKYQRFAYNNENKLLRGGLLTVLFVA